MSAPDFSRKPFAPRISRSRRSSLAISSSVTARCRCIRTCFSAVSPRALRALRSVVDSFGEIFWSPAAPPEYPCRERISSASLWARAIPTLSPFRWASSYRCLASWICRPWAFGSLLSAPDSFWLWTENCRTVFRVF